MVRIKAFLAVRPAPGKASAVASVPYDVVNTAEARALAAGHPESFLHVIRPEIDLPDETHPYDGAVYAKGRENFERLIDEGVLVRESTPQMYLYRQVQGEHRQIGLVCCCHIDDYANNIIKKHENTRQDKEDDRTRHVLSVGANTGPVFLTYTPNAAIDDLIDEDTNDRPLFHFVAPDGVTHTVWAAHDASRYRDLFAQLQSAYVADGHHRSASAARAGAELRASDPKAPDDAEYDWFLTVLFPSNQLKILAYNRVLTELGDLSADQVLDRLRSVGSLTIATEPIPDRPQVVCVYLQGQWHRIEIDTRSVDATDAIESLDVALLQSRVLEPIFGIVDQRHDKRIDFVGGFDSVDKMQARVDGGDAAIAFSMHPTSIEQLISVSNAGLIMPPKSTWFEPKLRSGLFIHTLDQPQPTGDLATTPS